MRNYIVENLIDVERLRQEIKLREVLSLQMPLLNEWSKLDAKNYEALSKLTRKLHALSLRLPLIHGATVRYFIFPFFDKTIAYKKITLSQQNEK